MLQVRGQTHAQINFVFAFFFGGKNKEEKVLGTPFQFTEVSALYDQRAVQMQDTR